MSHDDLERIVLRDKVYIPAHTIDADRVLKKYVHYMYDHKSCRVCDNRSERHNYICDECPSFKGRVATCNTTIKNDIEYIGLPIGDIGVMEKKIGFDFDDYEIVDKRVSNKFRTDVKMRNFKLRDYQKEALIDWWEYKHGLIVAPPRSGKTPTMLKLAVRLGMRTIVLAHQHDFLTQFIAHIEEFTNLPQLEEKYKRKLFGFPKSRADFNNFEICVCTYQQFSHATSGAARFAVASKNYGTLLVDEVHKANANNFASIVSKWPSRIKAGVTATDKRKDGREVIVRELLGPVVSKVDIPQLQAKISIHPLAFVKPKSRYNGQAGWTYAMQFLSKHEERNDEILRWIARDLKKGHSIVIPVYFRAHVDLLVGRINEAFGREIAEAFVGGGSKKNKENREGILHRARERKTRVVVGIRSLLQLGLNVPAWSALYYAMPMSNEPNWKQESSRILTPDDSGKKRNPVIRMFVDYHMGVALGCWVNTYKQCIKFKHVTMKSSRPAVVELFEMHGSKHSEDEDDPYYTDAPSNNRNGTGIKVKQSTRIDSDPYGGEGGLKGVSTLKHGQTPREKRLAAKTKTLKDRANPNTPKGLFNP